MLKSRWQRWPNLRSASLSLLLQASTRTPANTNWHTIVNILIWTLPHTKYIWRSPKNSIFLGQISSSVKLNWPAFRLLRRSGWVQRTDKATYPDKYRQMGAPLLACPNRVQRLARIAFFTLPIRAMNHVPVLSGDPFWPSMSPLSVLGVIHVKFARYCMSLLDR